MPRISKCYVWGVLLLGSCAAAAGNSKTGSIDAYCSHLRADFAATPPYVFSGPDPWVQLDQVPASMPDDGLAFLYTAGPAVRWVFLRITDREDGWSEDIDYYYRPDGTLAKRERHLQSVASNIALDVASYYLDGRVIKEKSHHHALTSGKTDSSQFNDPDAPTFLTVNDLPFPEIDDIWKRLATLRSWKSAHHPSAWSISQIRSSTSSRPIESRTSSGVTPAACCSTSANC
jgi:hypothetical protein